MSKNVFSPVMCLRHLSNQGNTGLLLNLDLFEKKTICGKKAPKPPQNKIINTVASLLNSCHQQYLNFFGKYEQVAVLQALKIPEQQESIGNTGYLNLCTYTQLGFLFGWLSKSMNRPFRLTLASQRRFNSFISLPFTLLSLFIRRQAFSIIFNLLMALPKETLFQNSRFFALPNTFFHNENVTS